MVNISASALNTRNTRPAPPGGLALTRTATACPSTGQRAVGHQRLQEIVLLQRHGIGEHRKAENSASIGQQWHQRDQRGERSGLLALMPRRSSPKRRPACVRRLEPGPVAQRLQQAGQLVAVLCHRPLARRHAADASMTSSPAHTAARWIRVVRWSREGGCWAAWRHRLRQRPPKPALAPGRGTAALPLPACGSRRLSTYRCWTSPGVVAVRLQKASCAPPPNLGCPPRLALWRQGAAVACCCLPAALPGPPSAWCARRRMSRSRCRRCAPPAAPITC